MTALHNDVEPRGFAPHRIEQIADHLVTDRGDAHALAGLHEPADHPRAGERLARTRRPLNRERAAIELEPAPDREVERGLVTLTRKPICGHGRLEPWRTAKQQVEPTSLRRVRSATRSAESKQSFLHRVGWKVLVRERRGRMLLGHAHGSCARRSHRSMRSTSSTSPNLLSSFSFSSSSSRISISWSG